MTNNPHLALRRQWQDDTADRLTTLPFHEYEKVTELRGVYKELFRSVPFEDADGNETPAFRYEPESPIFQCAHCGNAFESKYPMTNSLFDCGCTEASIDGFETADGEPAMMFVLANGMLSETPMQTPYTPYQQPGVPMIDPVEPYAQGEFKPSTGEIVATAAVVIAIFTFTVLLQAAGY